ACVAVPVVWLASVCMHAVIAATRATNHVIRPAILLQICAAGIFIREVLLKLRNAHLMHAIVQRLRLLLFGSRHGAAPSYVEALNHVVRNLSSTGQSPFVKRNILRHSI